MQSSAGGRGVVWEIIYLDSPINDVKILSTSSVEAYSFQTGKRT